MASEEERAKIMAEYLASAENDEEELEEEFSDFESEPASNYPLLQGRLKLDSEDSRLIFLGTWCMKESQQEQPDRKTKFKLKSTTPQKLSLAQLPKDTFSVEMDGYFTTDAADAIQPYRKIKERGVLITFRYKQKEANYEVRGKGTNEYGSFLLEGTFDPPATASTETKYWLQCKKYYETQATYDDDDDDDDEASGDEDGADMAELTELQEDSQLSIEELRKKYYGGSAKEEDDDYKPPAAKKPKLVFNAEDDDDDDEYGF